MAAPILYPLVNGIRYDWSCIEISLTGSSLSVVTPTLGIKEVSYKNTLEPGEVFGTSAQILGRTRGQYKPEASMTLYKLEYDLIIASLGDGFMEKVFDVQVQYNDTAGNVITDKIIGARMKTVDNSYSQGTDALVVKVDLHVMAVIENGKKPLTNMLGVTG